MSNTSNSASSSPSEKMLDTCNMQAMELKVHIQRCERLMRQEALLERLPDKGAGVRHRYKAYLTELERRERQPRAHEEELQNGTNNDGKGDRDGAVGASLEKGGVNSATMRNEEVLLRTEMNYTTNLRMIEDKYKEARVPVEKIVRRMYEGSLSEAEIQRILNEVPPKYFLTHKETCERAREMARRAREEELQKLREQSSF